MTRRLRPSDRKPIGQMNRAEFARVVLRALDDRELLNLRTRTQAMQASIEMELLARTLAASFSSEAMP